ncbi:SAM-dependent methyltransferase [Nocardia sp. NPDC050799]|uniref:SAM-dependent methyltransferase n=1 Tax=Nocardia TaxID=1817 RepID=UPI0007A751A0|nr:SAM-dependent methyltransferase [Nocardia fusca]
MLTGESRLGIDTSKPHPARLRTRSEVAPFFEGLELVAPGLVTATEWYQEDPAPAIERSGFHVGVARIL